MPEIKNTAVLGAGVIGMSWAQLFLASGRTVAVFDRRARRKPLAILSR